MSRSYNNVLLTVEPTLANVYLKPDLQLNSLLDIIQYGKYNPNCYSNQIVSRKTNNFIKFYIMIKHLTYNNGYYPICLNDLYDAGVYNTLGYFEISPKLPSLTSDLTLKLIDLQATHYKLYINNKDISENYINISKGFTTAPYIFSNDNDIVVRLYNDLDGDKLFVCACKLLISVTSSELITGIMINSI